MERYRDSPVGRLTPIEVMDGARLSEYVAYVPDPLPTKLSLDEDTWATVVEASAALARLDGAARRLPNPYLLVRPALTEEAVSTSALEGTYAPLEDVLQAEYLPSAEVSAEATEIRNYIAAAELGFELIRELPICHRLVKEIHGRLMLRARGDSAESGEYRTRQNWIGRRRGAPVTDALFVPPPAEGDVLKDGLDAWERWVNEVRDPPVVVRAAMAHYQFETLHPFIDGNGRVGRLIAVLMMLESGELSVPLVNLSPFLEERRDEYVEHLREISATGAYNPWVSFFAEAVRAQSERALQKADRLILTRERFASQLHEAGVSGVAVRIADHAVSSLLITPTRAAEEFGVTFPAANKAIARLVDLGILREVTGRSYGRVFMADEVVGIVFSREDV